MANQSIDERNRPRKGPRWRMLCCFCLITAACTADTGFVDFAALARSDTQNDALACSAGFCRAKADFTVSAVAMPAADLAANVIAVLAQEPRTELVARDPGGLKLVFVQRSRIFRFPDTVNIEILPQGDASATLAIYSRSNYGSGDFGVNIARVTDWLAKLGVPATGN